MKNIQVSLLLGVLLVSVPGGLSAARAADSHGSGEETRNVINGATSGSWSTFLSDTPSTAIGKDLLLLQAGYTRELCPHFGASAEVTWFSASASDHALELVAGPELSLDGENAANTFYAQALGGFQSTSASGGVSVTHGVLKLVVGKRFELVSHVAYTPEVKLTRVLNDSTQLAYVPLSFSFLF